MASTTSDKDLKKVYTKVAIIGSGFSGLCTAIQLERWYGITDYQLFDRASSCAGTWSNNRYPGCACDIPAALYSFSFEQNPSWSRILAKQPEVRAYLEGVAKKYDINSRLHTHCIVKSCIWSDKSSTWTLDIVNVQTGEQWLHESPVVFSCVGGLDEARQLDAPGTETFKGPIFHTAQWDDSVDLKDKRVAVIGNGCTGIQVVPGLINQVGVKSVTHFVRAKHWIFPSFDMPYPSWLTWAFKNIPGLLTLHRWQVYWLAEKAWRGFYMDDKGAEIRKRRQAIAENYMRKAAPKEYVDMLIPEWEIGCKRRIFDYGYLQVLHKDNVTLTDKKTQEIVPEGIKTEDGNIVAVDAIILANGFNLEREKTKIKTLGRNGLDLNDHYERMGGPGAYSCVAMNGFPNYMVIAGPNTATGHTSVVVAVENTTNLAMRIMKPVFEGRAKTVEPKLDAEDQWNVELQRASQQRVWTQGGCTGWYLGKNGWVSTLYPWSQNDMWRRCMFPKWSDWVYKTSSGKQYSYWGLDRFLRPAMLLALAVAATVFFIRFGIKVPWQRLVSKQ